MLFFLVSCLSFLLLSQSFLKPKMQSGLHTFPWIFSEVSHRFLRKKRIFSRVSRHFTSIKRILSCPRIDYLEEFKEEKDEISLLDLPDLALDCILEKLSPGELCRMAGVCRSFRERCTSDHLWGKRMNQKWGCVIGDAAYKEWLSQVASKSTAQKSDFQLFSGFLWCKSEKKRRCLPLNSVMSCYIALETGKFWFPAQVFNREVQNGHVGFMLSCYDAHLSYGSTTDNFVARYRAQGRSMIEEGIEWKRIRAPSVDTPANVLHISDCLHELKPDDHFEIQWRRNKEFPYGWWYGVVGHLDSCGGGHCQCHISDTMILEFKQYNPGSRWRKTRISRKEHREVGNEADGFYGGIRKLCKKEEVEQWKELWPNCTLE